MTEKKEKKFVNILNNLVNGNISDFNKQVRGLSKLQMIELINYVKSGWYGDYPKVHNILTSLSRALEK